jgi:thioredoxin-related protein
MRTLTAKNLFQTKQQAKKDNKNILLLMHLEDCSWCHFVISEVIDPMIELKEYTDKLIIAQIQIHAGLSMVDFKGGARILSKNTEAPKILTNSSVGWLKRPPQDWLVLFIMF